MGRKLGTHRFLTYSATTSFSPAVALCERVLKKDPRIGRFRLELKVFNERLTEMSRKMTQFDQALDMIEKESSSNRVDALEQENQELKRKFDRIQTLLGVSSL